MGQIISAARAAVKVADKEAEEKAKQDLDILQKLVDSKLNEFQSQLNEYTPEKDRDLNVLTMDA
jgi:hypothetical protein